MSSEITDTWARIGSMLLLTTGGHARLSGSAIARSERFCCRGNIGRFKQVANFRRLVNWAIIALFFGFAAGATAEAAESTAHVDATRITEADKDPGNWMTYGRTYSEQRFSPLSRITADNVKQLGLAWYADLDTNRGQEATPLVIDGVLYVSTAWSARNPDELRIGGEF
jgi:glucose dehydrogenase